MPAHGSCHAHGGWRPKTFRGRNRGRDGPLVPAGTGRAMGILPQAPSCVWRSQSAALWILQRRRYVSWCAMGPRAFCMT
jgi:hypothetical protein